MFAISLIWTIYVVVVVAKRWAMCVIVIERVMFRGGTRLLCRHMRWNV